MAPDAAAQAVMPRRSYALGVHWRDRFVFSVPDLAQAEAFCRAFGLDVRREGHRLGLSTFGPPHCRGRIHANGQPERLQYLRFAAYAEDFDALARRVRGAGAGDAHPLSHGQGAWTRDADGTPVQVIAGPRAPPAVKSTGHEVAPPPPGKGAAPGRGAGIAIGRALTAQGGCCPTSRRSGCRRSWRRRCTARSARSTRAGRRCRRWSRTRRSRSPSPIARTCRRRRIVAEGTPDAVFGDPALRRACQGAVTGP